MLPRGGVAVRASPDSREGDVVVEPDGDEARSQPDASGNQCEQEQAEDVPLAEGRTQWRGKTLTPLRMPLFLVEVVTAGERGREEFAYAQALSAVKGATLGLIDKAVASTQVGNR